MIVRYAVLNDIHFPYESQAYYRALDIIASWDNLEAIYLNGDIVEIETLSRHPRSSDTISNFQYEVDYANKRFDEIQARFPDIPVHLVEGNHCYRLFRYIRDVCPELWGMLEYPTLFRFSDRGWRFYPYGPGQWVKCGKADLWLRHEPLSMGLSSSKLTADRCLVDVLYGHVHTHQYSVIKKHGPVTRLIKAYAGGWLGDISKPIFDYRGSKDNWVQGFNEITCETDTGAYEYRFHFL